MELHEIDQDVFICGQIEIDDIETLAKMGINTIICNRPNNEGQNQPSFASLEEIAQKHGIDSYYIPVAPPTLLPETIVHMREVITSAKKPMLAYCLSGGRSQYLYQIAKT